jgi:hypothetical protein
MANIPKSPGLAKALNDVFPSPIVAARAPTATDKKYNLGQIWLNIVAGTSYILNQITAGSAVWTIMSPGSSDVDTLTGDAGGAISPALGNITLAGGTNIGTTGAGSTITFNLDAAITLATSVTSPIYTSAAAMAINAPAGQNITMKMGDAAGANKISFVDSASAEVASIDSNGGLTFVGLTFTGLLTALASATINTAGTALNLGTDNSGDAVNIATGNIARAVSIATSAAAHTVNIGSSSAGAIAIASGAASSFAVSGAGIDLTLSSAAGRVVVNGEEAAADAVRILSAAGGLDVDVALQMNLTSSQNAADAVRILASAGGIDIDAVGAAGEDINILNTGGSVVISATESAADSIQIISTAGGIDISASGASAGEDIDITATGSSINITATEGVPFAIKLDALGVGGGIEMNIDAGGLIANATGPVTFDSSDNSHFTVSGAGLDLTLSSAGGSVIVDASEAAADALRFLAAAGGLDVDVALQMSLVSSQNAANAIVINASAGGIDIIAAGAAGEDLDLSCTSGSVNITSGEAIANSMVLTSAGGLDIAVTGAAGQDIDVTCTSGSMNVTIGENVSDALVVNCSGAASGISIDCGTAGVTVGTGINVAVTSVATAASPYTVLGTDYFITTNSTAGAMSILLPAVPVTGRTLIIYDGVGQAALGGNITIDGNGNNIAAGGSQAATKLINTAYESYTLTWNGTVWCGQNIV